MPGDDEPLLRNEGVGIVLDRYATVAWKKASETWEAVSSRIVTARLQIAQRGCRRCGGTRWTDHRYLSLMSVYAPTAKAPPGIKAKFAADFQRTLDALPVGDVVLLLGDFNAHVGKRSSEDDVWREVRGLHGLGTCNEAGEQLLELCAINNLTIMNTWFKKKAIHLGTWVHPATKQAHMIDFVMMRRDQRQLCADVRVYRSACCWTDHYLVKGKLMLNLPRKQRNSVTCVPLAVHHLSSQEVRDRYQQSLEQCLLQHHLNTGSSVEEQYRIIKECILSSAEVAVGYAKKKQPDWFIDATDILRPLLHDKARARQRYLQLQSSFAKREFRFRQRLVK